MKTRYNIIRGMALTACAALAFLATASQVQAQVGGPEFNVIGIGQGETNDTSSLSFYIYAKANVGTMSYVNIRMDNGGWNQAIPTGWENDGWVAYFADFDGLADGPHTFYAFPVDSEGNYSYEIIDFFVDTAPEKTFLEWADLPVWAEPSYIGLLAAENHISRELNIYEGDLHYSDYNTGNAAFRYARTTGNVSLSNSLFERYLPLNNDNSWLIENSDMGDYMTGLILLEEFKRDGNFWYYNKFLDRAPEYWKMKNIWSVDDIIEERRLWADDMYLMSCIDSDYYSIGGDDLAIGRMTRWLTAHLQILQTKTGDNKGLLRHTQNYTIYWGRGCGWGALGLAEALQVIPEDNPARANIMNGYLDLMEALKNCQHEDGLWGQVLDLPSSWTETSGSALFIYALIVGIDNGWLDIDVYGPVARDGWIGLVKRVDNDGNLWGVCVATNEKETVLEYLNRKIHNGDMHGQAPLIWAAEAMLRAE